MGRPLSDLGRFGGTKEPIELHDLQREPNLKTNNMDNNLTSTEDLKLKEKSFSLSPLNLNFLVLLGSSPLILGSCEGISGPENVNPNIILISVDDMGWSDLGCFGSEIRTPNLDRLAE